MKLINNGSRFILVCHFREKDIPKGAGFRWDPARKQWFTTDAKIAGRFARYAVTEKEAPRKPRVPGCSPARVLSYAHELLGQDKPSLRVVTTHQEGTGFTLRPYQEEAVDAAVQFLKAPGRGNGIEVLPTGSGKSLVIANVVKRLGAPTLIFQPTKEILEQNYAKLRSYGYEASVYSASLNEKRISDITFATIGSVKNKHDLFQQFRHMIIDECHLTNAQGGMYHDFIGKLDAKVLGVTATPYRLTTDVFGGSILKFLTRTRPRIFEHVIFHVQNRQLFDEGYLAPLRYIPVGGFDRSQLQLNSTGADYTDESVRTYYGSTGFPDVVAKVVRQLQTIRKGVLVFTRFVEESEYLVKNIPGSAIVTGKTPKKEREAIIKAFRAGKIRVVANCAVLGIGFDYPELDTVILACPTMSLARYYQWIGRAIRPCSGKASALVVDLCGNIDQFGKIEDLTLIDEGSGKWIIRNQENGTQLTNKYFGEVR